MMTSDRKVYFLPYSMKSASLKLLKEESGWLALLNNGESQVKSNGHIVIKWGNAPLNALRFIPSRVLNADVTLAVSKIKFLSAVKGKPWAIEFSQDNQTANDWLKKGSRVLGRDTSTGYEGDGITVYRPGEHKEVGPHLFYVKYIPKDAEYRVHVVGGKVIEVSRKVMPYGKKPIDGGWEIRTFKNGFVYQSSGISVPECVKEAALDAVSFCKLDFAGVDVIYNELHGKAYVLELNSAPGIEGQTIPKYIEAFKQMLG